MALRGSSSQSFLRSKDLISFSEISHDKEGNNILEKGILKEALARDDNGKFIRNKSNIAKILDRYGVLYRMIFNSMNMAHYTYDEIQEAVDYLSDYINDLGVSGIVEFHASDMTQNSDHIHFWISSEDRVIYNKIAQEMVAMGYSNIEDVYIQKYETNEKLDESEYVNSKNSTLDDRFLVEPIGKEAGERLESINEMLSSSIDKLDKSIYNSSSYLGQKYHSIVDNINELLNSVESGDEPMQERDNFIVESCTLERTEETNTILQRIKKLKKEIDKK